MSRRRAVCFPTRENDRHPGDRLGFVVGPIFAENLRRALVMARGDSMIFIERPISAALLAIAAIILIVSLLPSVLAKRKEALTE